MGGGVYSLHVIIWLEIQWDPMMTFEYVFDWFKIQSPMEFITYMFTSA